MKTFLARWWPGLAVLVIVTPFLLMIAGIVFLFGQQAVRTVDQWTFSGNLPLGMDFGSPLYRTYDSWADHFAEVAAWQMPAELHQQFRAAPRAWLQGHIHTRKHPDRYPLDWQETPVSARCSAWFDVPAEALKSAPLVENFTGSMGVSLSLDPDIAREINAALSGPGNWYACGAELFLLVPETGRFFFISS